MAEQFRDALGRFTAGPETASRFFEQIADIRKKVFGSADELLRAVAREGYAGLMRRSPVDKGLFRGNWRIGVNSPDLKFDGREKSDGAAGSDPTSNDLAKVSGVIDQSRFGDTIHITNSTPYSQVLEDGYSGQAPQGMISLTADDLRGAIQLAIAQVRRQADAGEFRGGTGA